MSQRPSSPAAPARHPTDVHLLPPGESTYGFVAVAAFLLVMMAWGFIHSRILGWL